MVPGADIINSSPAVGDDGNIYFGSFDNFLYCIDSSGSLVDRIDLGSNIWSSPAIYNNTLYVGTYGNLLYSINIPSTGVRHTSNAASGTTLAVEDFDAQDGFKVFYNEGHLNIISKEFVRGSHAVIYNLMGQKIKEADLDFSRSKTHKMPLEGSTGRIFFVNIFNDLNNSSFTKKVIVR